MNLFSDRWRLFHEPPLQTHVEVPDYPTDVDFPVDGGLLSYDGNVGKYTPSQIAALGGILGSTPAVQLGQEIVLEVLNDSGGDIAANIAVYISGSDGANLEITTADLSTSLVTALAIGMTKEAIADGATGFVMTRGTLTGIDTSAFANGDLLYLDTAGGLTDTRPVAGEAATFRIVEMGIVVLAAVAGELYLDPVVLPRLMELSDMLMAVPSNGDGVIWSATNDRFELISLAYRETFTFQSPAAATGVTYTGGYYEFGATNATFAVAQTHGTANAAKSAPFFLVLGDAAVDEITITVTGTSIADDGTATGADTEDIVIPDLSAVDSYFETTKKWIGQVSAIVTGGTAKDCNWGFVKYWSNNDEDYIVSGFDITWYGGASDATPDITMWHHQQTGWTYNAGAPPTPPTPIAVMSTDMGADKEVIVAEAGGYRRAGLSLGVTGSAGEGIIFGITNSVAAAFLYGNISMRVAQRR